MPKSTLESDPKPSSTTPVREDSYLEMMEKIKNLTSSQRDDVSYALQTIKRCENAEIVIKRLADCFTVMDNDVWAPADVWNELLFLEKEQGPKVETIDGRHFSSDEDFTVTPVEGQYKAREIEMYYSYRFPENFLKVLAQARPDLKLPRRIGLAQLDS